MTNELDELNQLTLSESNGRGINSVTDIIKHLQNNLITEAKEIFEDNYEYLKAYPKVYSYLYKLFKKSSMDAELATK